MEYRLLGRTGVKVSSLCLGDGVNVTHSDPARSEAIYAKAIDAGINFIDTADHHGASEEMIGRILKKIGGRDRIILATKTGAQIHGLPTNTGTQGPGTDDPNNEGMSRRHIIKQCEASLRRLQTDYVDIYYIHRLRSITPIDETLRALDDLTRAGKVRYIGTSSASAWQLVESLWAAKELGLNRFVCEEPPYNLLDRRIEIELVPMAQTYGFAICPYAPLAAGVLTGKYRRGAPLPPGSRLAWYGAANPVQGLLFVAGIPTEDHPLLKIPAYAGRLTDQVFTVVEQLQEIANDKGCTTGQLALAWCMNQPGITSPLIGPSTVKQLDEYLGARQVTVTPTDRERIDMIVPPGAMVSPHYVADFGPHVFRW